MTITLNDIRVTNPDEDMDAAFFNSRFALIVGAIQEAHDLATTYGTVSNQLLSLGLTQVNSVLGPILTQLSAAAALGFFIVKSTDTRTLTVSDSVSFTVSNTALWAVFTPTPFLIALDNGNADKYATIQLTNYEPTTGVIQANVLFTNGGSFSSSDWTIAASGATLPEMASMLTDAQTAAAAAAASAATAATNLSDIDAALAAIEAGGAVVSVNGQAGIVVLTASDISGLNSTLALLAPIASPSFTGTPTAPTRSLGNNSIGIATTAFVQSAITNLALGTASTLASGNVAGGVVVLDGSGHLPAVDGTAVTGVVKTASNGSDFANLTTLRSNIGISPVGHTGAYADLTGAPPLTVSDFVIPFVFDGGGSVITTGLYGPIEVPSDCTISRATLIGDTTGSIEVDIWKCTYSQYDGGSTHPVTGDKINSSTPPTISSAKKSQDSTLSGWTTSFSGGDLLFFNVASVTSLKKVTLSLKATKTA